MDLHNYEKKIFSQNGEDGIIIKLIDLLYKEENDYYYYVEFGVENGIECNTRILREKYNWKGLQMDGNNENNNINLQKEFITKENIIDLFIKYNVPKKINLLSVDIDYNDFYCLHEILKKYTCDIIICEYNSSHPPTDDKIVYYDSKFVWDKTNYFGASLLSIDKLCKKYNYSLIYCENKGVNCFLIHNDIIINKNLKFHNFGDIEKIYKSPKYGFHGNGHPNDNLERKYLTFEECI